MPTREEAKDFLRRYVTNEYQLHHAEMVAAAVKAAATKLAEAGTPIESDIDIFFVTGLVHDWDFDKWPDEHPGRYDVLQAELGAGDDVVEAIKGHRGVDSPRPTVLAKVLFACDELSGLFFAYMKMVGNYKDMKVSSIKKKIYKEPKFAAKISREDVIQGINEMADLGLQEDTFLELLRDTFSKKYD